MKDVLRDSSKLTNFHLARRWRSMEEHQHTLQENTLEDISVLVLGDLG